MYVLMVGSLRAAEKTKPGAQRRTAPQNRSSAQDDEVRSSRFSWWW